MKSIKYPIIIAIIFLMVACGPSKQEYTDKISQLESQFSDQATGLSKESAKSLVDAYAEYYENFPNDSLSAEYLFRAADISMNLIDPSRAIELYDKILVAYPDFRKAPQCLFLKAFVYENSLNDLVNAEKYYREFLEQYPDDDFADDAAISLENLGKSPEELIKEFEARMNQEQQPGE